MITINTSKGDISIQLDEKNTPKTVDNFLKYVRSGFYNGTIFHRVIDGFMIQGGGFDKDMNQKIKNVSGNVQGETIPIDINGLLWSNLSAYFLSKDFNLLIIGIITLAIIFTLYRLRKQKLVSSFVKKEGFSLNSLKNSSSDKFPLTLRLCNCLTSLLQADVVNVA